MHLSLESRKEFADADWDQLLDELDSTPFQRSAYIRFRCRNEAGSPLFILARDERKNIVGAQVAYLSSPRLWPMSRVCRTLTMDAYPCVRKNCVDLTTHFCLAIQDTARRWGVACIRLHSFCSSESQCECIPNIGFATQKRWEFEMVLDSQEGDFFCRISRQWRQKIRRAKRLGVEARQLEPEQDWARFFALHDFSLARKKRRGAAIKSSVNESFHRAIGDLIASGLARAYGAYLNDSLLSFLVVLVDHQYAVSIYAGSSQEGYEIAASGFLFWAVAEMLRAEGVRTFNIGGVPAAAESPENIDHGLYRFKKDISSRSKLCLSGMKYVDGLPATLLQRLRR